MNNKQGFSLTEVLLAVMIVAIIGVALASLTTAASRESAIGSSRTVLRNKVSLAMRQIRQDIHNATAVLKIGGTLTLSDTTAVPVLVLVKNADLSGSQILSNRSVEYVTYCFARGSTAAVPSGGAYSGGILYRNVTNSAPTSGSECSSLGNTFLPYVKYLPSSSGYSSPLFYALDHSGGSYTQSNNLSGVLKINMVLEIPDSKPLVNDAVEELFLLPSGGYR